LWGTNVGSDEEYLLDICDQVIGRKSLRRHRFYFLRGENGRKLPVDAFYPGINLVVEYRRRPPVGRVPGHRIAGSDLGAAGGGADDEKRRAELRRRGIRFLLLDVLDFKHDAGNRLLRSRERDLSIVQEQLAKSMRTSLVERLSRRRAAPRG
jgi:hypothetical protein